MPTSIYIQYVMDLIDRLGGDGGDILVPGLGDDLFHDDDRLVETDINQSMGGNRVLSSGNAANLVNVMAAFEVSNVTSFSGPYKETLDTVLRNNWGF